LQKKRLSRETQGIKLEAEALRNVVLIPPACLISWDYRGKQKFASPRANKSAERTAASTIPGIISFTDVIIHFLICSDQWFSNLNNIIIN
jgi:hypothetical protein